MRTRLNGGVIIGGKYQITAALGENPVGITYAGTAVQTAQKVIIREFMPQDCCERAEAGSIISTADVFEQEKQKYIAGAKILLANPGQAVAQVYELLEEKGTVYTIMEYVEGISLDAYLTQNKNRFPVGRIQVLIQPLLADFARLQEMGFIHGNISPDNLIFSNAGSLKLTGFGYVQGKVSPKSEAYAAAEMFQTQQPVSKSADVYALCASIYRCITGVAPQEAYRRMNQDMLQKPSALGVEIPTSTESALLMGMKLSAKERFQAMKAFARAFGQAQAATPAKEVVQVKTKPAAADRQPAKAKPAAGSQPVQANAPEKKKGGNGGTIALIIVGCVLIIGLAVAAFILFGQMSGKEAASDNDQTEATTEASSESTTETTEEGSEYNQLLSEGRYDEVINQIVTLSDTADLPDAMKEQYSQILQQALDAQYSDFESKVADSRNSNDYDAVFSQITEEEDLYNQLQSNSLASAYIDMQKLTDKRDEMKHAHAEYLMDDAISTAAAKLDESGLNDAAAKLQEYVDEGIITPEELQKSRESAYSTFVIAKITSFNNAGTDAETILQYINTNLANTGNNSQVLEFWDYYNALLGRNVMDATIRHQSGNGYILEYSNSTELTRADIDYLSQYEVKLAVYEIFARHGKIFSDQALNEYFQAFSWYQPSSDFDDSVLNEYEKHNLDLLISYQRSMGYR